MNFLALGILLAAAPSTQVALFDAAISHFPEISAEKGVWLGEDALHPEQAARLGQVQALSALTVHGDSQAKLKIETDAQGVRTIRLTNEALTNVKVRPAFADLAAYIAGEYIASQALPPGERVNEGDLLFVGGKCYVHTGGTTNSAADWMALATPETQAILSAINVVSGSGLSFSAVNGSLDWRGSNTTSVTWDYASGAPKANVNDQYVRGLIGAAAGTDNLLTYTVVDGQAAVRRNAVSAMLGVGARIAKTFAGGVVAYGLDAATVTEIEAATANVANLTTSVGGLTTSVGGLTTRQLTAEGEIDALQGDVAAAEAQITALQTALDTAEATILDQASQITVLQSALSRLDPQEVEVGNISPGTTIFEFVPRLKANGSPRLRPCVELSDGVGNRIMGVAIKTWIDAGVGKAEFAVARAILGVVAVVS